LILCVLGLVGPSLLHYDPGMISNDALRPPSTSHWLGTDELGRDVLALLICGIRTSLVVGVLAALAVTVIGTALGALAGFAPRWLDSLIMRVSEGFQIMPTFILAAIIVAFAGAGTFRVIAVIALLSWPQVARVMRGEVMRIKALDFVDAARCLGIREQAILWGEVVPNGLSPVIALGTLAVGQAILLEAALSFFGLTSPDVPSWGLLLNSGQRFFYQAWWLSVFPGIAILITVLAFNLLGDCFGQAFNPRAKEVVRS
jgi:peptide/nickel transport system permease protein